jgi:hypothetical protein
MGTSANTVFIGGDYATMPIIMAAAEVWGASGGKWFSRGFKGSGDVNLVSAAAGATGAKYQDWRRAIASGHYIWGVADNGTTVVPAGPTIIASIGKDALLFVVSKNCKITQDTISTDFDTDTAGTLRLLFGVSGTDKGYSADKWQAYTYTADSGERKWVQSASILNGTIGTQAMTVIDGYDMIEKVAADPYGIGYVSSAFLDIDKVTALNIGGKIFPNQNPKYRWIVRDTTSTSAGEFEYPASLIRTLRVLTAGDGRATAINMMGNIFADPEFQNGPLYRATSYWVN